MTYLFDFLAHIAAHVYTELNGDLLYVRESVLVVCVCCSLVVYACSWVLKLIICVTIVCVSVYNYGKCKVFGSGVGAGK